MQSRTMSVVEAVINIVVGIGVAFAMNIYILSWVLGIPVSTGKASIITAVFTVISLIRQYFLRRLFNMMERKYESTERIIEAVPQR